MPNTTNKETIKFENWDIYYGETKWWIPHWNWKMEYSDGSIYEWERENGKWNWYWMQYLKNWKRWKWFWIDWKPDTKKDFYIYDFEQNDRYDSRWFNPEWWNNKWINKDTGDKYDVNWFNWIWYDREGYDKEWYNIAWYDREGYDKEWYSIAWYDREGYNRRWYDRKGYDRDWYNKDWYNKDWYNKDWYDRDWYNRDWRNKEWINKRTWYKVDINWLNSNWIKDEAEIQKMRDDLEKAHEEYLRREWIISKWTRSSSKSIRETTCRNCHADIDNITLRECNSCWWIVCRCWACWCGYHNRHSWTYTQYDELPF